MWAAALSASVVCACASMSVRRLSIVASPVALDPGQLLAALQTREGAHLAWRLRKLLEDDPRGSELDWERAIFAALAQPDPAVREALWREQRMDFAARLDRWARAPRVGARLATSAGFLFACTAMLESLSRPGAFDEAGVAGAAPILFGALDALCIGLVGTSFCAAVDARSRVAARSIASAADRLLERLEVIAFSSGDHEVDAREVGRRG